MEEMEMEMEMEKENKKKMVMVAIDESECSRYALLWTLKNLRHSVSNSPLIVFTALSFAEFTYIYAARTFSLFVSELAPELITSVQENQKRFAAALLEKAKNICADHGIVAETITEVGDPKKAICEAVEKLNIRLLVLGSHGRGALKRAFMGSLGNYCVHNAKCPVLVVRKPV